MSMSGGEEKKYGLLLSSKASSSKQHPKSKPKLFSNEDEADVENIEEELQKEHERKKSERGLKEQQAAALESDPTVYDYDGVYDAMKASQQEKDSEGHHTRGKPKYIHKLLEKADQRKKTLDMARERKIQVERENEEEVFGGIEKFVTSAYKKKLQEDKLWREEQDKRDSKDEDVTKKSNLNSFYSNLLTNVAGEDTKTDSGSKVKSDRERGREKEKESDKDKNRDRDRDRDRGYREDRGERDRDREKERDRERERDKDKDKDKDRDRDRDRDRNNKGEKDRYKESDRNNRDRDHRNDRNDRGRERERSNKVDEEKDRAVDRDRSEKEKQPKRSDGEATSTKQEATNTKSKFARRNDEASIVAARERYLKRKGLIHETSVLTTVSS